LPLLQFEPRPSSRSLII